MKHRFAQTQSPGRPRDGTAIEATVRPDLAACLAAVHERFHRPEHLAQDPLRFPRRFRDPADQEVVGLLAASLAFGRVQAFLPVLERLFARLGPRPATALADASEADLADWSRGFVYRFVRQDNLHGMLRGMAVVRRQDGGLRPAFQAGFDASGRAIEGLWTLARRIREAAHPLDPGFLLPRGRDTDPAKRMNLFLRWMVRDDGLDLGTWPGIPKTALLVPMDVHVCRIARLLGLLPMRRSGPRLDDAIRLTAALAAIDPDDPVRLDFALSHLGISGSCRGEANAAACPDCPLASLCAVRPNESPVPLS